ncbi:MAG: tetratricopeptide repeat protein [Candidatus Acidoferrales bacterium]
MRGRSALAAGLLCFSLSLALAHSLAAQQGPSQQSTTRGTATLDPFGGSTYSISGRVLDRQTGQAIDGARVVLNSFTGGYYQEVYVDSTGYYRFSDLRSGTYYVVAMHPGYKKTRTRVEVSNVPVSGLSVQMEPKPRASDPLLLEPLDVADHLVPKEAQQEYEKGVARADQGELREALEHFDIAVEIYPDYVTAWYAKGLAHLRLNESAESRAACEKAIEINPNTAPPRILLGHILNNRNRFQEALEHLLGAVLLRPKNWRGHFELGRAYLGLDRVDGAESEIVRAHKLNPKSLWVHLMRANVCFARQDFNGALEEMDHYLELAPDGPQAAEVRRQREQLREQLAAQK